jgi:serine/threonine protein kinase
VTQFDHPRFDVRGTLGAGGAGVVYRAYDHQLRRTVALKVLRHAVGRDLYRFKREFRSLADIVHPNLVALHELYASSDHEWFFAMELVEGVSFIDWVRPVEGRRCTGRAPRQDIISRPARRRPPARRRCSQLIDALVALHRVGKLHRDLKPSNVLVTPEGRAGAARLRVDPGRRRGRSRGARRRHAGVHVAGAGVRSGARTRE